MEDMSNVIGKLSEMLNSSDAPNDIKEMVHNLTQNSTSSNDTSNNFEDTHNNENNMNIDIDMILKAKKIMDAMSCNNDPRKDLLLSLKPYLKNEKKEKIDKYIKFLNISKAFEIIGPEILGSDKNV